MNADELRMLLADAGAPTTPAGRMELAMALLAPVYVESCPCCGQDVEKIGEPLISPEAALELMAGGEGRS